MNIPVALYTAMASASLITGKIATYGGAPAIFTARPVPRDAPRPYLVVTLAADTDISVVNAHRRSAVYDITAIADVTGSAAAINALAEAVAAALDGQRLTIAGGAHVYTRRQTITAAPTDATLVGRTISFEIVAQ